MTTDMRIRLETAAEVRAYLTAGFSEMIEQHESDLRDAMTDEEKKRVTEEIARVEEQWGRLERTNDEDVMAWYRKQEATRTRRN